MLDLDSSPEPGDLDRDLENRLIAVEMTTCIRGVKKFLKM